MNPANEKIGNYTIFANKVEAKKVLQGEQCLEFATEGMRFFYLRSRDKLPGKIGGKSMAEVLTVLQQPTAEFLRILWMVTILAMWKNSTRFLKAG